MTTRQPNIEWVDITQKQPDREVLAIGYQEEMLVGYCYQQGDQYVCEAEGVVLERVTHWMDLGELRVLRRVQSRN
ncbi:hypothetical protein DYU11_20125 [Fibrisoma montanum]|uniref:DUF551 domain-containing protein n=1 Tax=Fibrisoma montanum TaxID=2305895 RepID=A0A418M3P5_9BACT|nr:hypothetical protein [Fibrisoma montanum]RIV20361.1 hypothetical protein DYU11_20125 [Fibrisoma montanum]